MFPSMPLLFLVSSPVNVAVSHSTLPRPDVSTVVRGVLACSLLNAWILVPTGTRLLTPLPVPSDVVVSNSSGEAAEAIDGTAKIAATAAKAIQALTSFIEILLLEVRLKPDQV